MALSAIGQQTVMVVGLTALLRLPSVSLVRSCGYLTLEATYGEQAVELYQRVRPGGILLDISQDEYEGVRTLGALRAVDPQARVTVLTSHATKDLVLAVLRAGARDVVAKPAPTPRIVQAIQQLIAPPTRRVSERIATALRGAITLAEAGAVTYLCTVDDLSLSGARCVVEDRAAIRRLTVETVVDLTITLPAGPAPFHATSRVARVIGPDMVAVTFLHMTDADQERLKTYYEQASAARAPGT